MSCQIIFHPEAEKEYIEAYHWYENERKGLGGYFEKMVDLKLNQILQIPEHYKIVKSNFREALVDIFPCRIVYKINKRKKAI